MDGVRKRKAATRMALPNLSQLRLTAVDAPTSPKRAAPDDKLWASLPEDLIDTIKQAVLESGDPESMCATFARLCALNKRHMCPEDIYHEALIALKVPRNTPPQPGVSWKERFTGVCREDAALRAAGGWMRRGILTASVDWEPFQLHTAVRRLGNYGVAAYPHLTWLMRARGGKRRLARPPLPAGADLREFPEPSAENDYTHSTYGPIAEWDVADVVSMRNWFEDADFNGDLSKWDVSSVEDMTGMFRSATSFDGDLSKWDVSGVLNMNSVFEGAESFRGDLSKWDVSKVLIMDSMFQNATSFDSDLSQWIVSKVETMGEMFAGATSFNSDLSEWDVSNVDFMRDMFEGATSFDVAKHAPWYQE